MRRAWASIVLLAGITGCGVAGTSLRVAQSVLEPYSFYVEGSAEGVLGINSRYLALDAKVAVKAEYRGVDSETGEVKVLWSQRIEKGKGKRAYEAVFGLAGKFVAVRPANWEAARVSMPFLPAP